jgi:hypothetical protein
MEGKRTCFGASKGIVMPSRRVFFFLDYPMEFLPRELPSNIYARISFKKDKNQGSACGIC